MCHGGLSCGARPNSRRRRCSVFISTSVGRIPPLLRHPLPPPLQPVQRPISTAVSNHQPKRMSVRLPKSTNGQATSAQQPCSSALLLPPMFPPTMFPPTTMRPLRPLRPRVMTMRQNELEERTTAKTPLPSQIAPFKCPHLIQPNKPRWA